MVKKSTNTTKLSNPLRIPLLVSLFLVGIAAGLSWDFAQFKVPSTPTQQESTVFAPDGPLLAYNTPEQILPVQAVGQGQPKPQFFDFPDFEQLVRLQLHLNLPYLSYRQRYCAGLSSFEISFPFHDFW